jgi:hypothetical protein
VPLSTSFSQALTVIRINLIPDKPFPPSPPSIVKRPGPASSPLHPVSIWTYPLPRDRSRNRDASAPEPSRLQQLSRRLHPSLDTTMAGIRKRSANLARRRALDDEDRSVAGAEDSQSDISVQSDVDEHVDADNSDLSEVDSSASLTEGKAKRKTNTNTNNSRDAKARTDVSSRRMPSPPIAHSDANFPASRDTEMMMNGLGISGKAAGDEGVDFETGSAVEPPTSAGAQPGRPETFAERKRREHEEYKKKRDADPAFIPNRGAFFMHDQRSASAQHGSRQFGGRAMRGGGGVGGPFSPAK